MMQVVILCKAPVPGRVKTRLMPDYSATEAAALHASMAVTVIDRAHVLFQNVRVAADDPMHPFFAQFDVPIVGQGEGSLGERLARLLHQAQPSAAGPVMFLGTDSPHMKEQRLLNAVDLIACKDVVFGPVEDGGYDLVLLKRDIPELFAAIDWGTSKVLRQSLDVSARLSLSVGLLDIGFDVDTAEDLQRAIRVGWLQAHLPSNMTS